MIPPVEGGEGRTTMAMRMQMQMRKVTSWTLAVAMLGLGVACQRPPKGERRVARTVKTVKASIAEFDPNADVAIDLAAGGENPDEWLIEQALQSNFEKLDACVVATKQKLKLGEDVVLEGDVDFQIKLNPKSPRPFAVNAKLSAEKWDKNAELKDCLRDAIAAANFPKYDGVSRVVEISTQLDPGYTIEFEN